MNKFDVGSNPFDMPLYDENQTELSNSFNEWIGESNYRLKINSVVENRFYQVSIGNQTEVASGFGASITNSRYLVCVPDGFYGLEPKWDEQSGKRTFVGFVLHDIGRELPVLGKNFDFKFCSFHVIGSDGETTLFLVVQDKSTKQYHYLYLNESSLDETYGFTEIDSTVVDQLVVRPPEVFTNVKEISTLNTVNIALTDYGFWDIEKNATNNVTQSYRGVKEYGSTRRFNDDISKLITPTMEFNSATQKAVEYSSDEPGVDRIWSPVGEHWYKCEGIVSNGQAKMYRSNIYPNDVELPFVGGTENFAVYNHYGDDPIHILVNLTPEQFKQLLFSDSKLTTYFIEWLYHQVVEGPRVVNGSTIHSGKGEYYLWNNNGGFIAKLGQSLGPNSGNSFDGLELELGKPYTSDIKLDVSTKFGSVDDVVKAYDPPSTGTTLTMTQYCNDLFKIVNAAYGSGSGNKKIDVNWLVDSIGSTTGEARIKDTMKTLFSKVTWPTEKFEPFVKDTLDKLVSEFKLLKYFRDYLELHLKNDLSDFDTAISSTPTTSFVSGEKERVVTAVQDYIKGKVGTSLVLGSYDDRKPEGNGRYMGIDQYIFQCQRKLNKLQVRDIVSITNTLKEVMFAVQSTKFINGCDSFAKLQAKSNDTDLFKMA